MQRNKEKEASPSGLAAANCGECRRRKQKCNREWPCNRCHARKVPHLCDFGGSTTSPSRHTRPRAWSFRTDEHRDDDKRDSAAAHDVEAALHAFSTGSDASHGSTAVVVLQQSAPVSNGIGAPELEAALDMLYSSEYTGLLVQHFLYGGNYYHYILYDTHFTQAYTRWWQDRRSGQPVSAAFTCLVLRLCACAAQYLPGEKKASVEDAFGRSAVQLAQSFHDHAQRLGATVPPGTGELVQVQQMMLGVIWLRTESQWTAAWHALGATIHEAQEQDKDPDVCDFEKDMSRQAWCLLCAWDWQSSSLFGRPPIISQGICTAKRPVLKLYSPVYGPGADGPRSRDSGVPAPSTHMILQYELALRMTTRFGVLRLPMSATIAMDVAAEVRAWLDTFPEAYARPCYDADTDSEAAWLAPQRAHLHSLAHIAIFTVLKPCMARADSAAANGVRQQAIDAAIATINISHALHSTLYPDCSQPNVVFFATVSSLPVLCPALIDDDDDRTLPRRADMIACIGKALEMLHKMAPEKPVAQTAFAALYKLALQLHLSADETMLLRRTHQWQRPQRPATRVTKRSASAGSGFEQLSPFMCAATAAVPAVPALLAVPAPAAAPISPHTPGLTATGSSFMASPFLVDPGGDYMALDSQVYTCTMSAAPAAFPYSQQLLYETRNGGRLYDDPPPLSQTTPMAGLQGLGDCFDSGGLDLWPMDVGGGGLFMETRNWRG